MRAELLRKLGHTDLPVDRAQSVVRVGAEEPTVLPVDAIWGQVVALYRTGLHPAIGLTLRHRGRLVLDRTIGHVDHHPGRAAGPVATPSTPFNLFSASKILTAMAAHALVEDGHLGLETRVADVLPELGRHGKDAIRIRHLLCHTAGIPDMPPDIDVAAALRDGAVPWEALVDLRPTSRPGERVAYHPVTAYAILQRVMHEVSGRDLRELTRDRLLAPVGIHDLGFGVTPDRLDTVARHASTGLPAPGPMARIFERTVGIDLDQAVGVTNDPQFLCGVHGAANAIGTGHDVTRFLDLLLGEGQLDGVRVLQRGTVRRAIDTTTPLRLDGTFGFPMRYGLGVMRGGRAFSLFGLDTPEAFGHLGFTNVVVFADPSRDLSVSFLNTGKPMFAPGMVRWYRVLQAISAGIPRSR